MKVIGIGSINKYICEVDHYELEKFLNLYYGKLDVLKIGKEIDLSAGYNHWNSIKSACESMESTMKQFKSAQDTMIAFTKIIRDIPDDKTSDIG